MRPSPCRLGPDRRAVAPVIAVILMVGVAVVLASMVYLLATGFTGRIAGASTYTSCNQHFHGNGVSVLDDPIRPVERDDLKLVMVDDNDGTVWNGTETGEASESRFKYDWSHAPEDVLRGGDELLVTQAGLHDEDAPWDKDEGFTFRAHTADRLVMSCTFRWRG